MSIKLYQRHMVSKFLKIIMEISGVFFTLIFIIGLLEEVTFFKEIDKSFFYPILLTLLNIPSVLYDIFPFIFIISTQFFFIRLVDKDEFSLFKSYGISNLRIISVLTTTSLILSFFINVFFYHISSQLKYHYLDIKNNFSKDNKYLAVISENGLWIKDESDKKIKIINSSKLEENFIIDVDITEFDENFNLLRTINSKKVNIATTNWVVEKPRISKDNKTTYLDKDLIYQTSFNSNKLRNYFTDLKSLSFLEIYTAKKNYEKLGYSTKDIELHLFKFYTYPFYLTIMTIFSCVIMINIKHNKPKVFHVILGILISVIIYYINLFSNILGQSLEISNKVSNLIPIMIISLTCCIGLIKINEK